MLQRAVAENSRLSNPNSLNWGIIIDRIAMLLGFRNTSPGLEDLSKKVYEWQQAHRELRRQANGIIGPNTLRLMCRQLRFRNLPDFVWPVDHRVSQRVSRYFGRRIHPMTRAMQDHNGIDIAAPSCTRVIAADEGIIREILSNWQCTNACGPTRLIPNRNGNFVIIDHCNNYKTSYVPLSAVIVQKGQWIARGQDIGFVGSTGCSSGPHLHFTLRENDKPINPLAGWFRRGIPSVVTYSPSALAASTRGTAARTPPISRGQMTRFLI